MFLFLKTTDVFGLKHPYEIQIWSGKIENPRVNGLQGPGINIEYNGEFVKKKWHKINPSINILYQMSDR